MRSDITKYYQTETMRRHNGEQPSSEPERSVPFAMGPCVECGRSARLCSSAKCVTCHTAYINDERRAGRNW